MRVTVGNSMNMKLTIGLLYAFTVLHQTCAALPNAYVYTFDGSSKHQAPSEPPLVSPTAARLLLAQRLGLSQYHTIDRADENTIELINRFGGTQDLVFNDSNERISDQKVLIFVENVERPEGMHYNPKEWGRKMKSNRSHQICSTPSPQSRHSWLIIHRHLLRICN